MTKDQEIALARDISDALMDIKRKHGEHIACGAIVIGTSDGNLIVEHAAKGKTPEQISGTIASLLAEAAERLKEQSVGLGRGVVMHPTRKMERGS